jgi:hypothetical protein
MFSTNGNDYFRERIEKCYDHNGFQRQNSPAPAALFVATGEDEKLDCCLSPQSETGGKLLAKSQIEYDLSSPKIRGKKIL